MPEITPTEEETRVDEAPGNYQTAFPSYDQAKAAVDNITSLAEAKAVMSKMVDAIYAIGRYLRVSAD